MNTGPGEALRLIDIQDVLKAVSEFCDLTEPFVGERFKKQLRNTIRAVPRAPLAAVEGDALRNLLNQFLLDKYGCTIEHYRVKKTPP